jgi:glycosyltransferase involved in cell wall biosynthesis
VRVSIIMPLYNKAPFVERALDSIAAQTYKDFEVIVVDDGSTDKGAEVVKSYIKLPIKLIAQENAGPGAARNRGLNDASGEFVAFLDADDEWLREYLQEGVRLLEENAGAVSVTFGYFASGESRENMWRARGLVEGLQSLRPETSPMNAVHMLAYMSPCTTIARTDTIRKWGGFYSRDRCLYAEDAYLWLKILLNENVIFKFKPLARFHLDASGLSRNLKDSRPVEPFVEHPEEIERVCPPHLTELLRRMLAIRAFKTACVLGYWGHWREAGDLVRRFKLPGAWQLPYYRYALICRTPIGSVIGKLLRTAGIQ